jgi:hypothetical protein
VLDEAVDVFLHYAEVFRIAAHTRGPAMAARVPGKHVKVFQVEFIDDILQPPGMFVTAVEKHDSFRAAAAQRRPMAVK